MSGRASWWIVSASLVRARGRAPWSLASLVLVGALVASLLGVRARVGERAGHELARFGPNVVVVPADAGAADFPAAWLPTQATLASLGAETAVAVRRDTREGESVALVQVLVEPSQGVPEWAKPGADGHLLADADRIVPADELAQPHAWSSLALRVPPDRIDRFVDELEREAPGLSARVVRSVAFAETRVLQRTGAFVLGAALIILGLSGLCLSSTLTAQWIDRRSEIGLLLALGATRARIARLFAGEIATLAVVGGVIGGVAGSLLGWWILRRGFAWDGSLATWPWWTLAAAPLATLVVAAAGSAWPLMRASRAEPVEALRAE